jgi:hypothetical protein
VNRGDKTGGSDVVDDTESAGVLSSGMNDTNLIVQSNTSH